MRKLLMLLIVSATTISACDAQQTSDPMSPYGVWQAEAYEIQDVAHKQDGMIIITPGYLMSNTIFNADDDDIPDANANSGPITIEDGVIVMTQWMQLHWRTADTDGHFLKQDVVERIPYRVEGDTLIFEFPSGNRYQSKRLSHLYSSGVEE